MSRTRGAYRVSGFGGVAKSEIAQAQENAIIKLLTDYGPHTTSQISEETKIGPDRVSYLVNLMRTEGVIERVKLKPSKHRKPYPYWILAEDARGMSSDSICP